MAPSEPLTVTVPDAVKTREYKGTEYPEYQVFVLETQAGVKYWITRDQFYELKKLLKPADYTSGIQVALYKVDPQTGHITWGTPYEGGLHYKVLLTDLTGRVAVTE